MTFTVKKISSNDKETTNMELDIKDIRESIDEIIKETEPSCLTCKNSELRGLYSFSKGDIVAHCNIKNSIITGITKMCDKYEGLEKKSVK